MIRLCRFSKFNFIFNLTLFLQLKIYFSLQDNHFGDCVPKQCGNLSISYPFYMLNEQKSYCGYPDFEVLCQGGKFPYINISDVSYMVKSVSYKDQTIQVINSKLMESFGDKKACFETVEHLNLTLSSGDGLKFTVKHDVDVDKSEIYLLLNCSEKVLKESVKNMVFCGAVGVYQNTSRLKDLEGKCKGGMVSVPYEGVKSENVTEMLEEGFGLKWFAPNCSNCKRSGGQCGYDHFINEFDCFCPDRTHAYHCLPPPILNKNSKSSSLARFYRLLLIFVVNVVVEVFFEV